MEKVVAGIYYCEDCRRWVKVKDHPMHPGEAR